MNDRFKFEQIDYYKQKSIDELKLIQPKWAYGQYENRMLDPSLRKISNEHSIFLVDTAVLFTTAELFEVNTQSLFTGDMLNDTRISRILFRWESNHFVDPPTVVLSRISSGRISFADGRHRTKLAYFLKISQIPVAIHNSEITEISKIICVISAEK